MWQNKLKEIIYIIENSNVNEIEVTFWGRKYRVKKKPDTLKPEQLSTVIQSTAPESKSVVSVPLSDTPKSDSIGKMLAPMPGTFYIAASPDDPPFVSKGDHVKKGHVLCIIEAMKIMNEIESEHDGVVTDILVNNSDPVEYNQPLFVIDPV
tara:strand:- start:2321 stop:2773 length:453 start_codon:yes stop_codon:yes gene_type:complete